MATPTEPATSAIFRALRSVDVDPDLAGRCKIARLCKRLPPGRSSPLSLLNSHPSDRPRVRSKRGEAAP